MPIKKTTVMRCFKFYGIYPENVDSILNDCTSPITPHERARFLSKLGELKNLLLEKGEMLDSDFDRLGFPLSSATARYNLILSRRRCVILTNYALIAREITKMEEKANPKPKPSEPKKRGRQKKVIDIENDETIERKAKKAREA